MIGVLLACNHTVYRNPPGLKVPPTYAHCGGQQAVLRWYVLPEKAAQAHG